MDPLPSGRKGVRDGSAEEPAPLVTPVEQQQRLREFGLSEYATRAYLALLKLGTSEARAISRLAQVPIAKIYSTLDQLAVKGLCTVEPGPPKRFTPVAMEAFLESLVAQRRSEADALEKSKEELARLFPLTPSTHMDDRGAFQVLRGRRATLDKLRQLYDAKPQGVLLHSADNFTTRSAAVPLMAAAQASGAHVRLLARIDATTIDALGKLSGFCEIRAKERGMSNILVAVFDTKSALITHFIPDDGSSARGQDVSLFTTEEAIVGALSAFVEHQWETAERFERAKERIARGEAVPYWRTLAAHELPAAYARAIHDAPGDHDASTCLQPSAIALHRANLEKLAAAGHRMRFIAEIANPTELALAETLAREVRGLELRHCPHEATRIGFSLLPDRAFFTIRTEPGAGPVDTFETNEARFVANLRQEFELRWKSATPLAQRKAELR